VDSTPLPPKGETIGATRKRRLRTLIALPIAALVLTGCNEPAFWAKPGVTTTSKQTFHLWQGFSIAAVIIGAFVLLLIAYAVLRYRRKGDTIPKQTQYHIPLELAYTIIPIVIVFALFAATVVVENKVTAEPTPSTTINAYAFQWGWKFKVANSNAVIVGQTTQSPMFEMPVGTDVRFHLNSLDVVHGFYIRAFNFSRYAQPGVDNTFTFHAEQTGTYFGQCTQLCGLYHAYMWFRVKVVTQAQYQAWLAEFNTPEGARTAEAAALATASQLNPGVPVNPSNTTGEH